MKNTNSTYSTFRQNHLDEIKALAAYYRHHLLNDIMPFWDERVIDKDYGGYLNGFDRFGNITDYRKYGWFIGRNIYIYSALYNYIEKRQEWLNAAQAGYDFLVSKGLRSNYRVNLLMERDGGIIAADNSIFTDHFAVKGLFEYISATNNKDAVLLAEKMYKALLKNINNEQVLLSVCPDSRFRKHAVNFLNLIVGIEGKHLFPELSMPLINDSLHASLYLFATDKHKIPLEYILHSGEPLLEGIGRFVDPGHTLESLWFSMREGLERKDPQIIKRAAEILDWVIELGWDEEYGGFYQNVDAISKTPDEAHMWNQYPDAKAHWQDKIWWVQAEGLYTLAFSALLNSNEKHFKYFLKLHRFCMDHFVDKEYGEWYSILKRDGSIRSDAKGSGSKGPYHIPRCIMLLVLLFEHYINDESFLNIDA